MFQLDILNLIRIYLKKEEIKKSSKSDHTVYCFKYGMQINVSTKDVVFDDANYAKGH